MDDYALVQPVFCGSIFCLVFFPPFILNLFSFLPPFPHATAVGDSSPSGSLVQFHACDRILYWKRIHMYRYSFILLVANNLYSQWVNCELINENLNINYLCFECFQCSMFNVRYSHFTVIVTWIGSYGSNFKWYSLFG